MVSHSVSMIDVQIAKHHMADDSASQLCPYSNGQVADGEACMVNRGANDDGGKVARDSALHSDPDPNSEG